MVYRCLECGHEYGITELLYTCPRCRGLFMLEDKNAAALAQRPGAFWRRLFDYRRMLNLPALSGIFRYYELIAPVIPLADIIYLGEGHTPQVAANPDLQAEVGAPFYFKNDGQNPSASFKDRGMAAALSYLNFLAKQPGAGKILAICASTGDTSAAAALYSAYLGDRIASAVILPRGKVTPQQLAQPLGSGAKVLEVPGVFDDCMKVVEALADNYQVALLNSKNSWRIRGQESYAYEIAQTFDYDLAHKTVVVPIGNAGNITAIMQGFLRLHDLKIIETLPRVIGVQSRHADPVFRYYLEPDAAKRVFVPVTVQAVRGPGRHDRQPGVHAPGDPPGRGVSPPGRGRQRGRGPRQRTGDHGLHAPRQPPRPHQLHPGRRIPGRPEGCPTRGFGGEGRNPGAGRHRPSPEIYRVPADVLRRLLPAGIRSDAETGISKSAAIPQAHDRPAGGENRRPGRPNRPVAGADPERVGGLRHRRRSLIFSPKRG